MIIEKVFKCSVKDVDEVALAIAEEIKNGWHIAGVKYDPIEMSCLIVNYPTFEVTLVRRNNNG